MRSFPILLLLFISQTIMAKELSRIIQIDDLGQTQLRLDVSEEALPEKHYLELLERINLFGFTPLIELEAEDIFRELSRDSEARMKRPEGKCSQRRVYIQNKLKKMNIISGKLLLRCPANNGRLRLEDQVSGRYYTYTNYHDTNIITVETENDYAFRVLDLQFEDSPVSLHDYLTTVEASQKIRPLKRKESTKKLCYWTISTNQLTY